MSKGRVPYLRASTGLNNKVDPTRVAYNRENGLTDLTKAVNVDLDSSGRIDRRKGYTEIGALTDCHSFYRHNSDLYFIGSGAIQRYVGVGTPVEVHPVSNERCSFASVGERLYFCDGVYNGYVIGETYYPWEVAEYVGPDTRRTYSGPPIGTKLCVYRGRMYIAEGSVVWYSNPMSYHEYDLVRNFIQPGGIVRMINRVDDGLYIGTDNMIKYYNGTSGKDFDIEVVANVGVVEGTDVITSSRLLKSINQNFGFRSNVILVVTYEGVLMLGPRGHVEHLTYDKLVLPRSNMGSAAVINGKYIFSLEP